MVDLNWTFEARRWLEDIFEYLAADNPHTAADVVAGIYEHAQILRVPGDWLPIRAAAEASANSAVWPLSDCRP